MLHYFNLAKKINGVETEKNKHENVFIPKEQLEMAMKHEKLLEFEEAAKIYKKYDMEDDVIRVRKETRNIIEQTVIQGDQVTKTEIKDSVVNRSNVGSGEKSKTEEIKEIKELLDSGAIDEDEFKQMKKEILEK